MLNYNQSNQQLETFEFSKPSALSSVVFYKNKKLYLLSPLQQDIINFIYFTAYEQFKYKVPNSNQEYNINFYKDFNTMCDDTINEILDGLEFKLGVANIAQFSGKCMSRSNFPKIYEELNDLKSVQIESGFFKGDIENLNDKFILFTELNKIPGSSIYSFKLSTELLAFLLLPIKHKMYYKIDLKETTKLNTVISKKLYEVLKDYSSFGKVEKQLDTFKYVLGIDPGIERTKSFSGLKSGYLNKAIKEINEKTDLEIFDIKSIKKLIDSGFETYMQVTFKDKVIEVQQEQKESNEKEVETTKIRTKDEIQAIKLIKEFTWNNKDQGKGKFKKEGEWTKFLKEVSRANKVEHCLFDINDYRLGKHLEKSTGILRDLITHNAIGTLALLEQYLGFSLSKNKVDPAKAALDVIDNDEDDYQPIVNKTETNEIKEPTSVSDIRSRMFSKLLATA